jgi:hypothetical protein
LKLPREKPLCLLFRYDHQNVIAAGKIPAAIILFVLKRFNSEDNAVCCVIPVMLEYFDYSDLT